MALMAGDHIEAVDLNLAPSPIPGGGPPAVGGSLQDHLDQVERKAIHDALVQSNGNRTAAARLLGVTFRSLRYRMASAGNQRVTPAGAGRRRGLVARGKLQIPSPNCDERPPDEVVRLVVIHAISLPPGEFGGPGIIDLFSNRLDPEAHPYFRELQGLRVSSHFLVRRDGELDPVRALLPAGLARGRFELDGTDELQRLLDRDRARRLRPACFRGRSVPCPQSLAGGLRRRYPIEALAGHSEIAPGRKTDPGPHFDWHRVHDAGADHCRKPATPQFASASENSCS
jgi:AmpD protein